MATQHEVSELTEAVRFQRDLYLFWRTAAELRGLPLTTRGFVARPPLRRLRVRLASVSASPHERTSSESDPPEADDRRLFFLRRLLQRLGLLTQSDARLVAAEREKIERFLAYPLGERLRICLRVWVAGGWWPDAPDASAPQPRLLAPAPPRLALARRRLTTQLATLPPGERLPIPPDRPASPAVRVRRATPSRRKDFPQDADAATVRAALLGPLAWLGIVALDAPASAVSASAPTFCTVTLAAAVLRQDGPATDFPETPGRIVAQPNFELVAFPPLTAPALLLLDTCAREVALDAAARYQLTRESIAQARQQGRTVPDLIARLESLTGVPLPGNVRTTLADWERQGERLRLTEDATVLDVRDAALLDALLADRTAAGWLVRRLTPTAALLVPEHAGRVRAWLLRRGELPAVSSPDSRIG